MLLAPGHPSVKVAASTRAQNASYIVCRRYAVQCVAVRCVANEANAHGNLGMPCAGANAPWSRSHPKLV